MGILSQPNRWDLHGCPPVMCLALGLGRAGLPSMHLAARLLAGTSASGYALVMTPSFIFFESAIVHSREI
jgi:hypothetical protein